MTKQRHGPGSLKRMPPAPFTIAKSNLPLAYSPPVLLGLQAGLMDDGRIKSAYHNETRDALARFWLRARRKARGLVILSEGLSTMPWAKTRASPILHRYSLLSVAGVAVQNRRWHRCSIGQYSGYWLHRAPRHHQFWTATYVCFIVLGALSLGAWFEPHFRRQSRMSCLLASFQVNR